MLKKMLCSVLLICFGCKTSKMDTKKLLSSNVNNKVLELCSKWKSSSLSCIQDCKLKDDYDTEFNHYNYLSDYVERASIDFSIYEARRKSFLNFIFSNYDLFQSEFIIIENFHSERIYYTLIYNNNKITFVPNIEKWNIKNSQKISDFNNIRNMIYKFKRDENCNTTYFSYSLVTLFLDEDVITKLFDKDCDDLSLLFKE